MTRPQSLLLLAALAALSLTAPASAAVPCNSTFTDLTSSGNGYDLYDAGYAGDTPTGFPDDTFDSLGRFFLRIEGLNPHYGELVAPSPADCDLEEDGREVVFPPFTTYEFDGDGDTSTYDPSGVTSGFEVRRRVYVPRTGGWARWVDTVTNKRATPITVDLAFWGDHYEDSRARVDATSSGDLLLTAADRWATLFDADGTEPPEAADGAIAWQSDVGTVADSVDRVDQLGGQYSSNWNPSPDRLVAYFDDIALAPGQSATYMFVAGSWTPPRSDAAAQGIARLAGLPPELYAGLTPAEIASIRNWPPVGDTDRDGRFNDADNCLEAANPGQENLDGDALGDACDDDRDGDGLGDGVEAAFGTNPAAADSDGDGKADKVDACPTVRGLGENGCPRFDDQPITGRVDPLRATARLVKSRDRRAPFRYTVVGAVVPPAGLAAERACSSPGFASVQVKRGRKTVGSRRARLRGDCSFRTTVAFRDRRKIGSARRLTVVSRFLGNRFLEPVKANTLIARVG